MGGNRRMILALFIWAMAAVIFMAAIRPNRTPALHTSILFALYTFFSVNFQIVKCLSFQLV